jgi:hypothetical protein
MTIVKYPGKSQQLANCKKDISCPGQLHNTLPGVESRATIIYYRNQIQYILKAYGVI